MPLFHPQERQTVESLAGLTYCNPFDPEFIDQERAILGSDAVARGAVWSLRAEPQAGIPALEQTGDIAERVAGEAR